MGAVENAIRGRLVPVGSVQAFAGSTAPNGWLLCAGQAVSRATYSLLYSAIGTTYGVGDGSTTFNVPDLRGRTVAGLDDMGGADSGRLDWANALGTAGGSQNHTLTAAQSGLPAHSHSVTGSITQYLGPTLTTYAPAGGGGVGGTVNTSSVAGFSLTAAAGSAVDASQGHNTMQPTMLLNWIIAALL